MKNTIQDEINVIGKMIRKASVLLAVREAIAGEGTVVEGSYHAAGAGFDVVVEGDAYKTARRLSASMPEAKISRITDSLVGVTGSRRGK